MSVRVMSLVWDSDVQAPERFTLLALADRADEDGKCWPSVKWLARKCQTSERTIRRHIGWLETERLIKRSLRVNDSSMYVIQLAALRRRKLPEIENDPCQSDTPGQIDTPDDLTPPDNMSPLSDWPGVTNQVAEGCQSVTQYVIDTSLTTSTSGTAALAPDREPAKAKRDKPGARPDVDLLCDHLLAAITANGSKAEITKRWRTDARLLLDRDGRDVDEAHRLIDWCQRDTFWQTNILSMPTFRRQYDKLRLRARNGRHLSVVGPDPDPPVTFDDLRRRGDARQAARIIGATWREPAQPPTDPTPWARWLHEQNVAWIDAHADQLREALARQEAG